MMGRRPKPPAYTRQGHDRSSEGSGWMSSGSRTTVPFQVQPLDRRLGLSGIRPLALISGQRKDEEALLLLQPLVLWGGGRGPRRDGSREVTRKQKVGWQPSSHVAITAPQFSAPRGEERSCEPSSP